MKGNYILPISFAALALASVSYNPNHPTAHEVVLGGYTARVSHSTFRNSPVYNVDIHATSSHELFDHVFAFGVPDENMNAVRLSDADSIDAKFRDVGDNCRVENNGRELTVSELDVRVCNSQETLKINALIQQALDIISYSHHPEFGY